MGVLGDAYLATNVVWRGHSDGAGIYLGSGVERVAGTGTLGLLRDVGERNGTDMSLVLTGLVWYLRGSGGAG